MNQHLILPEDEGYQEQFRPEDPPTSDVEAQWTTTWREYPCVIVINSIGFRCGYAGVPKGHSLFGADSDHDLVSLLEAHGGITFTGHLGDMVPEEYRDHWFFGFDCGHFGDAPDPKHSTLSDSFVKAMLTSGTVRTKQYVRTQCIRLADQLVLVEGDA